MDPQQLALQHFEKALLALAIGWLGYVGVTFGSKPDIVDVKDQLQGKIDKIQNYVKAHKATEPDAPPWEDEVQKNLASARVPSAREFPGWVLHNRPNVVYNYPDEEVTQNPVHEPPTDISVRAERGKINLSWQESQDNALVSPVAYRVQRQDGPKAKFKDVAEVGGDVNEYQDLNVNPRLTYRYRVVSVVDLNKEHPLVIRARSRGKLKTLDPKLKETISDQSDSVKTPRVIVADPLLVTEPTEAELIKNIDAPAKVNLKVYVWDKDVPGEWISNAYYNVKVGEKIGDKKKKKGKEYDFGMGKLAEARIEKRPHPRIKGHEINCYVIVIEYADGSKEVFESINRAKEIKDLK